MATPPATALSGASPSFQAALHTDRPAADRVEEMALYGQFIGRWTFEGTMRGKDGSTHRGQGEIHFGWVLDGRAVQDVWILPGVFHGSTLRVYDPNIKAWHILWSDPLQQYFSRQLGRANGRDIVQNGSNDAGETTRWSFSEITPSSFRWRGEVSPDGGKSWELEAEFRARRVGAQEETK
ncbi:MAG: hypothetical protein ACREXP_10730 [Steroidobacteraceae bacterium]